jgi:hypothetical protein
MNEFTDRRSHARHPIRTPLQLRVADAALRCRTGDLSEGGLFFESPQEFPAGTNVEVTFPIEAERFALSGTVANCAEVGAGYRIGVVFGEPSQTFRRKLAEQILRIQELRRELGRIRGEDVSAEEAAREWVEYYAEKFADLYGDDIGPGH